MGTGGCYGSGGQCVHYGRRRVGSRIMVLNDTTRKNLKTWLEKSLANHHEDGLVAYIEALVGDADGAVSARL